MSRDVGMGGDCLERGVAHVLGMRGGEADTHVGSRFGHHPQERREIYRLFFFAGIIAVTVHVLSQQSHFLISAGTQVGELAQDAFRFARAFPPPGVGHDAIGTEIVASAHYGDESAHSGTDAARNDVAVSLCGRQLYIDGFPAGLCRGHEFWYIEIGVGAGHQVHAMALNEFILHPFGHASDHADDYVAPRLAPHGPRNRPRRLA